MLPPKHLSDMAPDEQPRRHLSESAALALPDVVTADNSEAMIAAVPDGTEVWMAVPAAPTLGMTIRACLDHRCEECRLPVYRCESEGGQMLCLCASHLRLPD
jgi:hypothetical protein